MVKYPIRYTLMLAFLLSTCYSAFTQIGVSGAYRNLDPSDWLQAIAREQGADFTSLNGYSAGIDYWFRLKNKRIEFTPELSYSRFDQQNGDFTLEHSLTGFHFNTNVYLLDMEGDCNCPTFSKSGNVINKGFFLQLSPGVFMFENVLGGPVEMKDDGLSWEIGIGAGLDLGITEHITVTPMVRYYYSPGATWEGMITRDDLPVDIDSGISSLWAGLRLGYRFRTN